MLLRHRVIERDGYRCRVCHVLGVEHRRDADADTPLLQVDHIDPVKLGTGSSDPANLQTLCVDHHRQKTRRDHAEANRVRRGLMVVDAEGIPLDEDAR